jgi:hypothetical protein
MKFITHHTRISFPRVPGDVLIIDSQMYNGIHQRSRTGPMSGASRLECECRRTGLRTALKGFMAQLSLSTSAMARIIFSGSYALHASFMFHTVEIDATLHGRSNDSSIG